MCAKTACFPHTENGITFPVPISRTILSTGRTLANGRRIWDFSTIKKGSPIYRKTAIYRAFHTFSEYVFSMCTAVSAVPEMSCCFGKGFISELQSVPKGTSSTAFWSYSSSFRLKIPDAFTAPNPNAANSAAPTHRSQFAMELFPVWGRLTSVLEESVPVPFFGSTV